MQREIAARFATLLPHEASAVLAALRRDAYSQLEKASTDKVNANFYLLNHRIIIRVLEVLTPSDRTFPEDGRGPRGELADCSLHRTQSPF